MRPITATWKDGQIQPDEPVDWPEGCRLSIEPVEFETEIGMREEDWSNTPEAIAEWLRWYDSLEPLEFTPQEEADISAWRKKVKDYTLANMGKSLGELFE
jgi:hypothetical protein